MLKDKPRERPTCEEILEKKNLWAVNEEDFKEIKIKKLEKKVIDSKLKEEELTVYSMLRPIINLIENSSSGAETLKRSRSPEQTDQVLQQKKNRISKC